MSRLLTLDSVLSDRRHVEPQLIALILLVLEEKEEPNANASAKADSMNPLDDEALQSSPLQKTAAGAGTVTIHSETAAGFLLPTHEEDAFYLLILLLEENRAARISDSPPASGAKTAPRFADRVPHTQPAAASPIHSQYRAYCSRHEDPPPPCPAWTSNRARSLFCLSR